MVKCHFSLLFLIQRTSSLCIPSLSYRQISSVIIVAQASGKTKHLLATWTKQPRLNFKNHLIGIWNPDWSGFQMVEKRLGCKWSGFQMVGTIAIAQAWPLENRTIWNPTIKKSEHQMFLDFKCVRISIGWISDPRCNDKKHDWRKNSQFQPIASSMRWCFFHCRFEKTQFYIL